VRAGDKTKKLFFSGHSLGAAACTAAAWNLCSMNFNVLGILTFESPLVFNCAAALAYQSLLGSRTLRVTNQNDPVVHAPSHVGQYTHVGTELYMRLGKKYVCTFDQVRVCRDTMNHAKDCRCSSRDRFSYTRPDRHCKTKHYLTFDFCQCNDRGWIADAFSTAVLAVWVILILLVAYVAARVLLRLFGGKRGGIPRPAEPPSPIYASGAI
jgi:hypothetical protein